RVRRRGDPRVTPGWPPGGRLRRFQPHGRPLVALRGPAHARPTRCRCVGRPGSVPERNALLSRKRRDRLSPKEVEIALRAYEVMVMLDPETDERTVAPSLDTYLNVIRKDGGSVENVDVWGKRRLAYEINKKSEAVYAVIDLKAEPASVKELDRQLSLNETVIRTKVMRVES